jgi:hypothetical protein
VIGTERYGQIRSGSCGAVHYLQQQMFCSYFHAQCVVPESPWNVADPAGAGRKRSSSSVCGCFLGVGARLVLFRPAVAGWGGGVGLDRCRRWDRDAEQEMGGVAWCTVAW